MGKKAVLFIVLGIVLGIGGALAGVFFMLGQTKEPVEEEEIVIEKFDLKDGSRLTLSKVQIPLIQTGSKKQFLQTDITLVFKTAEAMSLAEGMQEDIKDAIMGVFEVKTAEELTGARNNMKEPVLNAVRELYNNEEDRENIVAVMISSFIIT